jgi:hypothetical protein
MTSPGKTYDYGERQDDHCERDQYREHQPGTPSIFFLVVAVFQGNSSRALSLKECTWRLARQCGAVKGNQLVPAALGRGRIRRSGIYTVERPKSREVVLQGLRW